MIGVKVNGAEVLQRKLNALAQKLRDRRTPNQALATELYAFVAKNFQTEGGMTERGAWEPLAESTEEWKERRGYSMILQNTGMLRQSFMPFHDGEVAGVGAQALYGTDPDTGKAHPPDIAAVHEFGLGDVPERPMLPTQAQALGIAMQVYGVFVRTAREGL